MKASNDVSLIALIITGYLLLGNHTYTGAQDASPAAIYEAPVLGNIEATDLVYTAGGGRVRITNTLTVSDRDNQYLRSATIRITSGFNAAEDYLRFTNQNRISGSWNQSTGILTLSGRSSVANYQTALRSVRYENVNTLNPSTDKRTVSFAVSDGDETSNTVSRNIVFQVTNTAPVLSGIETIPVPYCIQSGGALITSTLRVTDAESPELISATIQISGGYVQNQDLLRFTNQHGITGSWNSSTGILSLTGRTTIGDYQAALRSVRYENTNYINPNTADREISFVVNDGYENSNTVSRSIDLYERVHAVLSGSGSFCTDDFSGAMLYIDLSGTSPWRFTLTRDNGHDIVYEDITADPYAFEVMSQGTYRVKSISDAHCQGDTVGSGYARISFRPSPTAVISGKSSICPGEFTSLRVALTGTAPWSITYRRNGANPVVINNITQADYTLEVNQEGIYTLAFVEDAICTGKVSGEGNVTSLSSPDVELSGLAAAYDKQSSEWVELSGLPVGGTFSGPGVIPYENKWYFVPSLPPVGVHDIMYAYRESPETCYGYDTVTVRVLEASAIIEYEDGRTKFCKNDHPFLITGTNLADATGSFTISGDKGLVDHHNNTATVYPAQLELGEHTITYTYVDGTTLSVRSKFDVGNAPVADFSWGNECFQAGQVVNLTNKSTSAYGNLSGYVWKIYKSTGYDTYSTRDVSHIFPQAGKYSIDLIVQTSYGCSDTTKDKVLNLRPVHELKAGGSYSEDFDHGTLSWQSGTASDLAANSWKLDNPVKGFTSGAYSAPKCWYTYIPGENSPREQSWITSPCFDFNGIERPMLKLRIWRMFNLDRDGATLQYITGSNKTWEVLGELDDGLFWFNDYQIDGRPGDQQLGWSNYYGNGNDAGWVEARHSLDVLKDKKSVQFRIAYGSDGTARNNNGIAFDDFMIVERTRMVLLEHFTNSSDQDCKTANVLLNGLANENMLNIVDLQYHTSFPGDDPFNQHNPSVTDARGFYYGLADIPYTILNGGSTAGHRFDYSSRPLQSTNVLVESLHNSKFWINLKSQVLGNTLTVNAQVTALEDIPVTSLNIHIAVVEQLVNGVTGANGETSFESVVKALLPDAAGTLIHHAWNVNESKSVTGTWNLQHVYDPTQLRAVAFVQNESTGEVYQAAIDTIGVYSGINDHMNLRSDGLSYIIYPNPARETATLQFFEETRKEITLELYNSTGYLVYKQSIPGGTSMAGIPVYTLPEGLYLLMLKSRNELLGVSKISTRP